MLPRKSVKASAGSSTKTSTSASSKFPKEIWLQIVDELNLSQHDLRYFDVPHPEYHSHDSSNSAADSDAYHTDKNTLRSLCLVSKSFRELCLPLLREQVDICTTPGKGAFYKQLSEKGPRISRGLTETNPELLPLIRTVYMSLTRVTPPIVMPPISKMLGSCPNLHTITVPHSHSAITSYIANHFTHPLPTLKTFEAPSSMHNLLKLAPNVEEVECTTDDAGKFIGSMGKGNKKCKSLAGFDLRRSEDVGLCKRIVKTCPLLEELELTEDPHEDCVKILKQLKHLDEITVEYRSYYASKEGKTIKLR